MSTGASTLKVTLPDGRIVQYQRVSYDPEEPHSHYDIVLPRTRTSNLDCYAECFASTDFGLSRGLVLDNGAGFVPPYPLPEKVFVKWAERGDSERAAGLAREADFYNKELKELQGKNVPEFYGHYVAQTDVGQRAPFVLNVYERCGWADVKADEGDGGASVLNAKADSDEYFRQYMLAVCSIHRAGISHNQLALAQPASVYGRKLLSSFYPRATRINVDHHVLPIRLSSSCLSVRIMDFTRAHRHRCIGARLRAEGSHMPTYSWSRMADGKLKCDRDVDEQFEKPCDELDALEECSEFVAQRTAPLLG